MQNHFSNGKLSLETVIIAILFALSRSFFFYFYKILTFKVASWEGPLHRSSPTQEKETLYPTLMISMEFFFVSVTWYRYRFALISTLNKFNLVALNDAVLKECRL